VLADGFEQSFSVAWRTRRARNADAAVASSGTFRSPFRDFGASIWSAGLGCSIVTEDLNRARFLGLGLALNNIKGAGAALNTTTDAEWTDEEDGVTVVPGTSFEAGANAFWNRSTYGTRNEGSFPRVGCGKRGPRCGDHYRPNSWRRTAPPGNWAVCRLA
jgi:hypothetical protein